MTNDAWAALSPRERDALVAERLGLPLEPPCGRYHSTDGAEHDGDGWSGWCYTCNESISDVAPEPPRFTTDPAAARLVEDEIERRLELTGHYAAALCEVLGIDWGNPDTWVAGRRLDCVWLIARASPADRCLAALRALE